MKVPGLPAILIGLAILAVLLGGCGSTPVPTPAPTQTPWIVIVTATPGPTEAAELLPTQTPWIVIVTATPGRAAGQTAGPTEPPATAGARPTGQATAAPGASPQPTPAATDTAPTAAVAATRQPEPYRYRPPLVLDPPVGVSISWRSSVLMVWQPIGDLAADEYYAVQMEAYRESDGALWYGDYVWTRDTALRAEGAFLAPFHPSEAQGRALVYWWVSVMRKTGEDQNGKPLGVEISAPSEKRYFVTEPKPGG